MARFRASQGGVTARFGAAQARIVRDLVSQVAELLGADPETETDEGHGANGSGGQDLEAGFGLTDATEAPRDPVLARLLPDAYRDDPEAAGEFRRYTELSLRDGKVAAARTVLGTLPARGGRVRLSQPDAEAWLRALNDVRLALGVRLGVTDDFEEVGTGSPRTTRGPPTLGLPLAGLPPGEPGRGAVLTRPGAGYASLSC